MIVQAVDIRTRDLYPETFQDLCDVRIRALNRDYRIHRYRLWRNKRTQGGDRQPLYQACGIRSVSFITPLVLCLQGYTVRGHPCSFRLSVGDCIRVEGPERWYLEANFRVAQARYYVGVDEKVLTHGYITRGTYKAEGQSYHSLKDLQPGQLDQKVRRVLSGISCPRVLALSPGVVLTAPPTPPVPLEGYAQQGWIFHTQQYRKHGQMVKELLWAKDRGILHDMQGYDGHLGQIHYICVEETVPAQTFQSVLRMTQLSRIRVYPPGVIPRQCLWSGVVVVTYY